MTKLALSKVTNLVTLSLIAAFWTILSLLLVAGLHIQILHSVCVASLLFNRAEGAFKWSIPLRVLHAVSDCLSAKTVHLLKSYSRVFLSFPPKCE